MVHFIKCFCYVDSTHIYSTAKRNIMIKSTSHRVFFTTYIFSVRAARYVRGTQFWFAFDERRKKRARKVKRYYFGRQKSPCNHVGGPRWVADNQLAEILRSGVISSLLWSRIKLATVCRNGKCLLWTIATRGLELVQRVETQGIRGGMCSKEGTKSSGKWTTLKQVREENYIHVKNCF